MVLPMIGTLLRRTLNSSLSYCFCSISLPCISRELQYSAHVIWTDQALTGRDRSYKSAMSSQESYVDVSLEFDIARHGTLAERIVTTEANPRQDIPNGQIAAFSGFKLADAVSTFEIGDPNFDSEAGRSDTPPATYDATRNLTPEEAVEIMYQILRLQSTWIAGCPMSQSVFTSQYIHNLLQYYDDARNIETIQFRHGIRSNRQNGPLSILRCYCILVIKAIWGVNHLLKNSRIPCFEEGEHMWQTHGRGLFQYLDMQTVRNVFSLDAIDSAIDSHMGEFGEPAKALIFLQWDFLLALSNPSRLGDNYCFQCIPGYLEIIKLHLERFDHDENQKKKDAIDPSLCEKYPPLIPPRQIVPHKADEINETFMNIKIECETICQEMADGRLADPANVLSLKQYLYHKNLEHCNADLFIRTFSFWIVSTQDEGIWMDRVLNEIWQTTFFSHPAFSSKEIDVDEQPVQREIFRKQMLEFVEAARRTEASFQYNLAILTVHRRS
jgi:Mak10 subunit, NatC N(alpha)-terminal acetyltransferase